MAPSSRFQNQSRQPPPPGHRSPSSRRGPVRKSPQNPFAAGRSVTSGCCQRPPALLFGQRFRPLAISLRSILAIRRHSSRLAPRQPSQTSPSRHPRRCHPPQHWRTPVRVGETAKSPLARSASASMPLLAQSSSAASSTTATSSSSNPLLSKTPSLRSFSIPPVLV